MDSASFATVWFWLALIAAWSLSGRAILGVPADVIARARRDPQGEAGMIYLDWLSLCLPRWRLAGREGVWLLAITGFVLTSLGIMGFRYGLELAQALVLLCLPFALLFMMRLRLARRLAPLIDAARGGVSDAGETAEKTLKMIRLHRALVTLVSIIAIAVTALWATIFGLLHPNGF